MIVMLSETAPQDWSYEVLTRAHNGGNEQEVERVRNEHPEEPECVVDGRVLGAIAPFRCQFTRTGISPLSDVADGLCVCVCTPRYRRYTV